MKINSMQAPSTLIPEYIGSSFDAVLEVANNIEAVKVVAENVDTFGVPLASETTVGIAEIATQTEVNQKTNDSHIVTPKKLGAYAAPLVHDHATATSTKSGFLSATDKQKLDGIASNANNYTHPTSSVTAGTYNSVTVNAQGHITAGTNPTTLSGYGITDAVLLSDVATTATASKILKLDANSKLPASITGNATTATKLATARTINDVPFDGSANITINAVDSTSRIASSEKGVANGVATLGADGKISSSQLPAYTAGATAGAVDSVAGKTGVVTLVKADVGLSNVDNTSDINKPISSSQQSALDLKANIASPALTGTPSAPTATVGTSTTQIATTAFVNAEIANDAAPKSHVGSTGSAHGVATTSVAGFMSAADKIKLDSMGSGGDYTHPVSGVTAGTYKAVTVDINGHVTSGTNPTTLAGYGITDAAPSSHIGSTGSSHGLATTSVAGFMSAADKTKLDGLSGDGGGAQTITLTGDVTGSGTGSFATTLANSGVTAGTYPKVTVDAKGRVTAGESLADSDIPSLGWSKITSGKPTTLSGYGITDATASSHVGSTGTAHGVATQAVAGFMSAADKTKLDGLGSGGAATTADKLTTPRLINGTSFDGTSNISTANWGTSRIFTIGGVSKSVNGSSNVSWDISELGFLPSTGGSLSGKLTITSGGLEVSSLFRVFNTDYPEKYLSLGLDENTATITSTTAMSAGLKLKQGESTYFYVSPSGQLYAQGVYKVYHTNNQPTAADVGLGLVNNTADLDKPISTAMQAALNTKYSSTNKPSAADIGALPASGTAVAATKLATARTIAGKSFDGTANISITAADVGALSTSGGALSGNLDVQGIIRFTNTVASAGISNYYGRNIVRGSNQAINVFGNDTDAMYFDGNSLTAWQVRYNGTLYKIYHTGNKPTPAEIGAQPATSDSRVKSNITSLPPVLDKIMLIDPKTFTMEGREGTCVGTIAQDWEVDFPEVILNVPSTSQGEPEMLKGIDALGTIGILLKAIQELKAEIEELKNK